MHNGYVMVEGEKMAKSAGNYYTVRDLLAEFPGEAIRLALLSSHYRQPLDFTKAGIAEARTILDRLYGALRGDSAAVAADPGVPEAVLAALGDDLNTPQALAHVHEILGDLNKASDTPERARLRGALLAAGGVLGILGQDPEDWFKWRPAGAATPDDAGDRRAHRQARRGPRGPRLRRGRPHPRRLGLSGRRPRGRGGGHYLAARLTANPWPRSLFAIRAFPGCRNPALMVRRAHHEGLTLSLSKGEAR